MPGVTEMQIYAKPFFNVFSRAIIMCNSLQIIYLRNNFWTLARASCLGVAGAQERELRREAGGTGLYGGGSGGGGDSSSSSSPCVRALARSQLHSQCTSPVGSAEATATAVVAV